MYSSGNRELEERRQTITFCGVHERGSSAWERLDTCAFWFERICFYLVWMRPPSENAAGQKSEAVQPKENKI